MNEHRIIQCLRHAAAPVPDAALARLDPDGRQLAKLARYHLVSRGAGGWIWEGS